LIDIVEPTAAYSAGRFREDALRITSEIHARGCIPVLAGGTMLYFRSLTRGLAELPAADPAIRAQLDAEAARHGWPALHAELAVVDPQAASRLEPNDSQRIQRALEVWRVTGEPLSALQARGSRSDPLPFEVLQVALEPSDRAVLHRRIDERFRAMLDAGLLAEVEGLRRSHALGADLPSMRAVGYRQAWETLEGIEPESTLADRGIAATRQLAKRQLTWLRAMDGIERHDCLRPDLGEAVARRVEEFLSRPRDT
jgi:tRNA dimethylallyltransferase